MLTKLAAGDTPKMHLLTFELFANTKLPEWNGKKLRVPLEDDAIVAERGVEWLYPINPKMLLIK